MTRRTGSCVLSAACLLAAAARAQMAPIEGDWHGSFEGVGNANTALVSIDQTAPGQFRGVLSYPEAGAWHIPLEVGFEDGVLSFTYAPAQLKFEGTWLEGESVWSGQLVEDGNPDRQLQLSAGLLVEPARGIGGRWEGTLNAQGIDLRIVFRVIEGRHNTTAFMDSPDQLALGIPVTSIERAGDTVTLGVRSLSGRYEGTLGDSGQAITGTWTQASLSFPLNLARGELVTAAPNRPQTPAPPFPYAIEEVAFDNPADPGVRLACTLTIPPGEGPHPAALLISGSGGQDRDESLLEHKPFQVIADHLSRNAIAVLRCDDRGIGESTGQFDGAVPADFATDAEAALAYLRAHDAIDPDRTGIVGHSEGGMTGPMVAARDPALAFLVMMAGPGVRGDELLVAQSVEIVRTMGAPELVVEQARAVNRAMIDAVIQAPSAAAARDAVRARVRALMALQGADAQTAEAAAEQQAARLGSTYMRALLSYDPASLLPKITAPVLAINGSKDTQVPAWQNLPALRVLLAGHPDATIVELEGLNHLFQTAETGAPGEYADIEETFAPLALETISSWLAARMLPDH